MELALLMLVTGTLAVMAIVASLAPEAAPNEGALSDLDHYILENVRETIPSRPQSEEPGLR